MIKKAISWFEIPTTQLDAAQAFYATVLGRPMRREAMVPSQGAVFAYDIEGDGTGSALMMGLASLIWTATASACTPGIEARVQHNLLYL